MVDAKPLKLRARSVEDVDIFAACLQDALVPLRDVAYQRGERRFVMVVNRFMWEVEGDQAPAGAPLETVEAGGELGGDLTGGDAAFEESEARPHHYRTHSAVTFDGVRAVTSTGIERADKNQILSLLTIATQPRQITFHFSGGQALRLDVASIKGQLRDLGEPWPTTARPSHEG